MNSDYPALTSKMVDEINAGNYGWKAGMNDKWATATIGDAMDACGTLPSPPSNEPRVEEIAAGIPEQFDARENWPNCKSIKIIRDQSVRRIVVVGDPHCDCDWAGVDPTQRAWFHLMFIILLYSYHLLGLWFMLGIRCI